MHAGWFVGIWIVNKVKSWGGGWFIQTFSGILGSAVAAKLVSLAIERGASGLFSWLIWHLGVVAALSGPAGWVGAALGAV